MLKPAPAEICLVGEANVCLCDRHFFLNPTSGFLWTSTIGNPPRCTGLAKSWTLRPNRSSLSDPTNRADCGSTKLNGTGTGISMCCPERALILHEHTDACMHAQRKIARCAFRILRLRSLRPKGADYVLGRSPEAKLTSEIKEKSMISKRNPLFSVLESEIEVDKVKRKLNFQEIFWK